ncbi:hypothetical protein [Aliikangiella maris]|uniref:Uncharacterized protein n=2 Tax=Aliikangiella maris TaxID=3162458 RepID=A0ABV3MRA6_9GAMM
MAKVLAVSVFLFGFVFIGYAAFFVFMAVKDHKSNPKGLFNWLKDVVIVSFCLFVAANTISSGYYRMIQSGIISE